MLLISLAALILGLYPFLCKLLQKQLSCSCRQRVEQN